MTGLLGVVADRIVGLGRMAIEFAPVGQELAPDRIGRIAGPNQRRQRRRQADGVAPGDRLELVEPLRRGKAGLDEVVERGQAAALLARVHDFKAAVGADGGGRTRTASRPRDFKSLASTGFATSAGMRLLSHFRAKMNILAQEPQGNRAKAISSPLGAARGAGVRPTV